MDFTSIGSLNSYLKNLGMKQKWQEKKQSGQYSADKKGSVNEWQERQRQKAEANSAGGHDKTLQAIHSKLELGTKLTADEEKYLQQKDPQAYQRLQSNKAAQKKFEEDLKKCKTKEDVQKLKQAQTASSLGYVRTIMNDSAIPKEKKLEIVMSEHQKMTGIEKAAKKFVESGAYDRLPTDAEKAEAEKLLKEAEEAKMRPAENAADNKHAEAETVSDNIPEKTIAEEQTAEDIREEISAAEVGQVEKTVSAFEDKDVNKDGGSDARKAALEAETSPVVQKVKRAKNGYGGSDKTNTADVAGVHIIETKA